MVVDSDVKKGKGPKLVGRGNSEAERGGLGDEKEEERVAELITTCGGNNGCWGGGGR